jgi:uncharacterized surface protein with fasciclin (FAS1) repeats
MSDTQHLVEAIANVDMFSVFARLMKRSGANDLISGDGPFSIFAPTNDAFGGSQSHVGCRRTSPKAVSDLS